MDNLESLQELLENHNFDEDFNEEQKFENEENEEQNNDELVHDSEEHDSEERVFKESNFNLKEELENYNDNYDDNDENNYNKKYFKNKEEQNYFEECNKKNWQEPPSFNTQQEDAKSFEETPIPPPVEKIGLESKGYLFLKGIFQKDVIDRLNFEVNQFMQMEGIYSHLQKRQDVPLHRYYVNNTYGTLTNFQQIQHYFVPVIDNRGTYNRMTDVGVVDIYNADKLFTQIRSYFDLNLINMLLLKTTGIEWKLTRVNLQIHSNVQNPMSFHFDGGNEKNIKFTIYLSDIRDDYSGPPVFMENTHRNKKNIKPSQSKIFHGEKGDVLISYQNGFHRKLAQKVQCTNMFLTFHFTTKLERERYFPLTL